ncbi:MAG: DUF1275 domain-containing protein [Clostridia bacterium]|nr:DUF1275 domain-containing protein [Clostridia bacterium]
MFISRRPVPVPQHRLVCLLLTFTGGFLDVYTYFTRGGIFANAQSTNMILMSIRMAEGNFSGAGHYLVSICSYAAGVLISGILHKRFGTHGHWHWRQLLVAGELAILFAVGLVPTGAADALVNLLVSFICAIQVASFGIFEGMPYASTMCTGNLRSGVEHLYAFATSKDRRFLFNALRYFTVIFVFILSAFVGVFLVRALHEKSIWICCGVLMVVLAYLILVEDMPSQSI